MISFDVNVGRLQCTIEKLASIGRDDEGITRFPLSKQDLKARTFVMKLMREAGLEVRVDPIGNICAKRTQAQDPSLPSIMTGSHICTGYRYGKYDGTVGVLGALEAVRLLNEKNITTVHPIEIVVFTAEEPQRFKAFMPGSRAMAGNISTGDLRRYMDENGVTIWDALIKAGYHPENLNTAQRTKKSIKSYVEMHIEQGRVLEDAGKRIGIVTGIAAPTRFEVFITGRADHSGATPMGLRKDALCAAAELTLALEQYAQIEAKYGSVATVGNIVVEPGSMVVIPGKVRMLIDIRGIEPSSKKTLVEKTKEKIQKIAESRKIEMHYEVIHDAEPVPLSNKVMQVIKESCEALDIEYLMMPSGAGHDAQQIARFTDVGMIFVPSVRGISHSPDELTKIGDIALGTKVLTNVLVRLGGIAKN
jgi:N-carbamoyl-L-amino-acid hydrolase